MTGIRSFLVRHYKITISLFILPAIIILAQDIGYKEIGIIRSDLLNEISGIVQGRRNPNVFWVHNDSGDKSNIYAISRHGDLLGIYRLENARNRDWEDIAAGPGPVKGIQYLYIGEIGDNEAGYPIKTVYRVPEPYVSATGTRTDTILTDCTPISFTYPDGPRDAECLIVDPENADFYVLSKRDAQTHVYYAPYPQPVDTVFQIQMLGTIGVSGLTAGDISADGRYIILKNYTEVFVWHRQAGTSVFDAISRPPERLPYIPEPQGESIAWDIDRKGYITTSEVVGGISARLIHYNFVPDR